MEDKKTSETPIWVDPTDYGYTCDGSGIKLPPGWKIVRVGDRREVGDLYCVSGEWAKVRPASDGLGKVIVAASAVTIRKLPKKAVVPVDAAEVVVLKKPPEIPPEVYQTINEALSREWTKDETTQGRWVDTKHNLCGLDAAYMIAAIIEQYKAANWDVQPRFECVRRLTFYPCKRIQDRLLAREDENG